MIAENYLTTATPDKVVPLLGALNRVESLTSVLALRLDPIVNHVPLNESDKTGSNTVTYRLTTVGDALQYLLDNIEL